MNTINIYALPTADQMAAMSPEEQDRLMAQLQVQRHVKGIDELGIPRFRITNGPVGVGMGDGHPSPAATALPMSIALAAGFDPELANDYGDIIGSETATLGQYVLEGHGVCLHRTPIAAMMSSYNRIRGVYATENRYTLHDVQRRDWGFTGYVQSDFWSCRSCAASLSAGMDHEMPDGKWLSETNIKNALEDTSLEIQTVDRALVRHFRRWKGWRTFCASLAPRRAFQNSQLPGICPISKLPARPPGRRTWSF